MNHSDVTKITLIVLFTVITAYGAIHQLRPPRRSSLDQPSENFSSARAMKHLEVIAQKPHPIGSSEHTAVRSYIMEKLRELGLSPVVQKATVVKSETTDGVVAATVNNLLARLEGTNSSKAILLAAHYDSVPTSPGASDDGAGVTAILETLRALRSGTPLKNDVITLFTDGEESGLLGAGAFVKEHPWAKDIGLALNFEARGSSGPSIMFETSDENGLLVRDLAKVAPFPIATSLSYDLYKLMPNSTDFTVFRKNGMAGFNFAYIDGLNHYHSAKDTIDNIDQGSLQHHGSYALALTRHFGQLNLNDLKAPNVVYFFLPGSILIHYPYSWIKPLELSILLLFVGVAILGFKRRLLTARGLLLGFCANLLSIIAASLALSFITKPILALRVNPDSPLLLVAYVALIVGIASMLYGAIFRRVRPYDLAMGAMVWWAIALALTSAYLPGGSYLFALPLLFGLGGVGYEMARKQIEPSSYKSIIALCISSVAGILLVTPMIFLVFQALGLGFALILTLLVVLLFGMLSPQAIIIARLNKWLLPGACALTGVVLIVTAGVRANSTNATSQSELLYILDADTQNAVWVHKGQQVNEPTPISVGAAQTNLLPAHLYHLYSEAEKSMISKAPIATVAAPDLKILDDQTNNGVRVVRMLLTSPRQARLLSLYVEPKSSVLRTSINGQRSGHRDQAGTNDRRYWELMYLGVPTEGIELILELESSEGLKMFAVDRSEGLPDIAEQSVSDGSKACLVSKIYKF